MNARGEEDEGQLHLYGIGGAGSLPALLLYRRVAAHLPLILIRGGLASGGDADWRGALGQGGPPVSPESVEAPGVAEEARRDLDRDGPSNLAVCLVAPYVLIYWPANA